MGPITSQRESKDDSKIAMMIARSEVMNNGLHWWMKEGSMSRCMTQDDEGRHNGEGRDDTED